MINFPMPRIDTDPELHKLLLKYCKFKPGDIWEDPLGKHKIGCLDATDEKAVSSLLNGKKSSLAALDPPYNFVAFDERDLKNFIEWSSQWIMNTYNLLLPDASLYVWLGADQNNHFQPLPDFILMMKESGFNSRSFITMRNQRGYGTQKNWMAVRQELLFYTKGNPFFDINSEYTDIPKILRGYYKKVNGRVTENLERGKSEFIRAGNVWVDIQQVFYRMEENVNGCYAQKPLKAIIRIIQASSKANDTVLDFFSHSGTTIIASEITGRNCCTCDIDPVYCEITKRRLENFRKTGKTGWQNSNPFAEEIIKDKELQNYLKSEYQISKPKNDAYNLNSVTLSKAKSLRKDSSFRSE
ncbi:MAG: site-specific DNA-methyltransferase [Ignavibacteria bacterium]|nr:site-specific DNA-methyltransferase [Ignavibacteria bacterium]